MNGEPATSTLSRLNALRTALDMNDAASIHAAYLLRKMARAGLLTGRARARCAAAALAACRSHGMGVTVVDVERASGVPRRQIYTAHGLLSKAFGIAVPVRVRVR